MGRQYSHLSSEERAVLQVERDNGIGIRAIARRLGRSASTLSREIKRQDAVVYSAHAVGKDYRRRRSRSVWPRKLVEGSSLFQYVLD